ncbi:hypothetical protein E2C01_072654 [Portunus trituberculatus]|uniref:Uncharacterized protein n=1 Tax=Portunus trituberculatus TaxID=210409 RepID=A0A5B7I346_PORTR|nr:hypothetical protein [Portunus trituberculatus]
MLQRHDEQSDAEIARRRQHNPTLHHSTKRQPPPLPPTATITRDTKIRGSQEDFLGYLDV